MDTADSNQSITVETRTSENDIVYLVMRCFTNASQEYIAASNVILEVLEFILHKSFNLL